MSEKKISAIRRRKNYEKKRVEANKVEANKGGNSTTQFNFIFKYQDDDGLTPLPE